MSPQLYMYITTFHISRFRDRGIEKIYIPQMNLNFNCINGRIKMLPVGEYFLGGDLFIWYTSNLNFCYIFLLQLRSYI